MKKLSPWILIGSIMFISSSCFIFQPQKMTVKDKVPLNTVFGKVLDQFTEANNAIKAENIGRHTLTLSEADVVFDNVVTDQADVSLSLLIFKAGYTRIKKKETTVTYTLMATPENPGPRIKNNAKQNPDAVKNLIIAAFKQFITVSVPPEAGHFEKDVEIDVSFTVDQSGDIEVSDGIGQFTPDATLTRDVANTHTIKIVYVIDKAQ